MTDTGHEIAKLPPVVPAPHPAAKRQASLGVLAVGAMGVVFGDIGTSPLYALRDTFAGRHRLPLDQLHILGIVSLMFWSMLIMVTLKYVIVMMRADNRGEGGSLALLALINREGSDKRWGRGIVLLGVLATALFYGDAMITPAVSVMGAIEGIAVYRPELKNVVLPLVVLILIALFVFQARGTQRVAALFGPIMLAYFATIAVLGVIGLASHPQVMMALLPHHAALMLAADPWRGFLAMGAAVLAVTGAEALYADMGYFGRLPIRCAWLVIVLPALVLNYLGQAALLLSHPAALESPFFLLAPPGFQWPLLVLASLAAVIASQAVISGVFSVTQQAIQLGFVPRMTIRHTSQAYGQVFIPSINRALLVAVIMMVLVFKRSTNLTATYGVAVTGAMLIDNVLLGVVLLRLWHWPKWAAVPLIALFGIVDALYLGANLTKVPDGGWVPLMLGLGVFILLTTWSRGRALLRQTLSSGGIPLEVFAKSAHASAIRVPGTAVFMASAASGVPAALLHNMKHNKVLHERVVLMTVLIEDTPFVDPASRAVVREFGNGFYRLKLRFGFLEETDVPAALAGLTLSGEPFEMMRTSFFLTRQTLLASDTPGMALWREKLFSWMMRNSASAMVFFRLPTNRVVELGSQIKI